MKRGGNYISRRTPNLPPAKKERVFPATAKNGRKNPRVNFKKIATNTTYQRAGEQVGEK